MPSERWTYGPAPVRQKKTTIVRSRTGCQSCRTRRKKCDERKPVCTRCEGSGTDCLYVSDTVEFRHVNDWAEQQVKRVRGDRLNLNSASSSSAPSSSNAGGDGSCLHVEHSLVGPAYLPDAQSQPDTSLPQPSSQSTRVPNAEASSSRHVFTASLSPSDHSQDAPPADFYDYDTDKTTQISEASSPGHVLGEAIPPAEAHLDLENYSSAEAAHVPLHHSLGCCQDEPPRPVSEIGSRRLHHRKAITRAGPRLILPRFECVRGTKRGRCSCNLRPSNAAASLINKRNHIQPSLLPNLSYPGLTARDHSYLSHFTNHVAHILPTNPDTIISVVKGSHLARHAAMAISAANLANLRGKFSYDCPSQSRYSWTSDPRHRVRSLAYAGEALAIATDRQPSSFSTLLASHLMLTFVELGLGTFEGLRYYIASVDGLVYNTLDELMREEHGPGVLRGLVEARSVQKFVTGPFRPPTKREMLMDEFWKKLENRMSIKSDLAQNLGCEMAIRLERLCLLTTMQHNLAFPNRMQNIVMKYLSNYLKAVYPTHWSEEISGSQLELACQECLAEVRGFSEQIFSLPIPQGLPPADDENLKPYFVTDPEDPTTTMLEDEEPLRFNSHRESMVAADYALCRMLCDESIILRITNPSGGSLPPVSANGRYWMSAISRISRGLNVSECSSHNIYRRGICGMLLHSAARCGSTRTLDVVEDLINRLISKGSAWEDCMFANTPAVSTVRAIRSQLEQGRSILMVSSLDESANANTTIMSNRMVRKLIVHGWEADGRTFDETLHLDDFATALGS